MLPLALLPPALLLVLLGLTRAQRPAYSPTSSQYYIKNNYLVIELVYENFQGYFLNTYTLPAGASRIQHTAVLALACLLALSHMRKQPRSCKTRALQGRQSLTRPMARPGGPHRTLC